MCESVESVCVSVRACVAVRGRCGKSVGLISKQVEGIGDIESEV